MTNKQIDELVLKKWYWIWKRWDNKKYHNEEKMVKNIPKLKKLVVNAYCIWCKEYRKKIEDRKYIYFLCIKKCPLEKIKNNCFDDYSNFEKWNKIKSKRRAKAMLDKCIEAIRTVRKYAGKEEMIENVMKGGWLK